jgi:hypothetical protein
MHQATHITVYTRDKAAAYRSLRAHRQHLLGMYTAAYHQQSLEASGVPGIPANTAAAATVTAAQMAPQTADKQQNNRCQCALFRGVYGSPRLGAG